MDSRKREYLDKIAMYLFEDTDFEYVPNDKLCSVVVDTYFTTDCFTDWTYHDHTLIQDFCIGDYGLNEDEVKYVWREYNKMIFDKVREIININRNLNESTDNNHIQKVVSVMKPPYIEDLRMFKIPTDKWEEVFSLLFKRDINSIELDRNINRDATILYVDIPSNPPKLPLYVEWDNGPWIIRDYDDNGNMTYYEENDGYWEKSKFDSNNNPIYYENSEGYSDDYSENNLNESVSDKENMVIDKIVNFMLEDTVYKIKTIKDEPVARIVYPFYNNEVYTEDWDGCDYHLNYMDEYPLNVSEVNYISNQYGITDTSIILEIFNRYIKILFTKIQKEIEDKMEDDSLNESIETNNRFLDKVVESLINDTKINTKLATILYPPINFHSSHMSLLLPSDAFYNEFADYCNKHYGITPEEFDIVWGKYSKIMFDKFDESDNILKESDDRRKNYLDKVLEFILSDTQIESNTKWSNWINIFVPFTNLVYSRIMHFDREDFFDYCRDTYGLTKDESYSVWEDYIDEVNQILINEWGIKDPIYH